MYKDSLEEIHTKHKREEEQKSERTLDHETDLTPPKKKVIEVLSFKSPTLEHISEIS